MEQPVPMDRLVCGDVGYGKTEIAVRAAFKAVQDGKQVAVLVPTTLLVQQHTNTFVERFAAFPVTVRALSRFQSDKEAAVVLEGLADGSVDVVIGTHRLLQATARFKDLGLVIVDEEQRFGVEHKEHLKALRTHVDVLTLSATPIPRTLEMALGGHPGDVDDPDASGGTAPGAHVRRARTTRSRSRQPSVASCCARARSSTSTTGWSRSSGRPLESATSFPRRRVEVAHGQMGEDALERIIVDFWEKRFDVLVCTTIVESGLDISNANTLIVERGDMLGPGTAAPAAWSRRSRTGPRLLRTSSTPRRSRSPRRRTIGWPPSPSTPTSGPAWRWP